MKKPRRNKASRNKAQSKQSLNRTVPPIRPPNVPPLDPDQFLLVVGKAYEAAARPAELVAPPHRFALTDERGVKTEYRFEDHPLNRVAAVLLKNYGDEFRTAHFRFHALHAVDLDDPRMLPYVIQEGDDMGIHANVIRAAATVPVTKDVQFDTAELVREIERLMSLTSETQDGS